MKAGNKQNRIYLFLNHKSIIFISKNNKLVFSRDNLNSSSHYVNKTKAQFRRCWDNPSHENHINFFKTQAILGFHIERLAFLAN